MTQRDMIHFGSGRGNEHQRELDRIAELEAELTEARVLVREMKDALAIEGYDYYFDGRIDEFLNKK